MTGAPEPMSPPARPKIPAHIVIFLAPAFLLYTIFMVWPLFDSIRLGFYTQDRAGQLEFVGLGNYERLFFEPAWSDRLWGALYNNVIFFIIHLLVQNPVALLLAALLCRPVLRLRGFYRTAIFVPVLLSQVIVGFIWQLILNPLWGVSQTVLGLIGLEGLFRPWLGLEGSALVTLSLISVWQWVGLPMILFLAALLAVPEDLVDAARIDGAGDWRIFWSIKFPLILPTVGLVTILTYIGNFNAFDLVYVMQGIVGDPNFSTDLLGLLFYRTYFGFIMQLGNPTMAAAVASVTFLIILAGLVVYQVFWQGRTTYHEL